VAAEGHASGFTSTLGSRSDVTFFPLLRPVRVYEPDGWTEDPIYPEISIWRLRLKNLRECPFRRVIKHGPVVFSGHTIDNDSFEPITTRY